MEKIDYLIIFLMVGVVLSVFLVVHQINKFMPVLKTCDDDFAVINKCGCMPCTWKDAEDYGTMACLNNITK